MNVIHFRGNAKIFGGLLFDSKDLSRFSQFQIILILVVVLTKAAPTIFILWSVEYLLKWNFVQERTFF